MFEGWCLHVDVTKKLSDQEYNDIIHWKNDIKDNGNHCCEDGKPGKYIFITVDDISYNIYGSMNVGVLAGASCNAFHKFCDESSLFESK